MQLSTQEVNVLVNEVRDTLLHAEGLRERLLVVMEESLNRGYDPCPACGAKWKEDDYGGHLLDHEPMCNYIVLRDHFEDKY